MPRKQHLIVIHGRATKPAEKVKRRLVREALLGGLRRADPAKAEKLRAEKVTFTFVYYGDINNRLMLKSKKKSPGDLRGKDPDHGNAPCELPSSYDADLQRLLTRDTAKYDKRAYKALLGEVEDRRMLDDVASLGSGLLNLIGLSDNIIRTATPDMGAYLTTHAVGSEVRERLQGPLRKALLADEDVCLVSHSMGCIVGYDVLWKFSRMSEYKDLRGRSLSRWITLGNPLGEPGVQDNLFDSAEDDEARYPDRNIGDWLNIAAHDDFVAHDGDVADDFKAMKKRRLVRRIHDQKICNFWVGFSGSNPHKLYGYLDHPKVGARIAEWIR